MDSKIPRRALSTYELRWGVLKGNDLNLEKHIVRYKNDKLGPHFLVLSIPQPDLGQKPMCKLIALDGTEVFEEDLDEIEPVYLRGDIDLDTAFAFVVSRMLKLPPSKIGLTALAARTRLLLYQLRPLIKYFNTPSHRLLIADEAGLGKTIESLYILVEEMNRKPLNRVIVMCPSHLKGKWWWEILSKFGIGFSTGGFNELLDLIEHPESRGHLIISQDCANSPIKIERLQEAMRTADDIDFLIIDEIHHCIGRSGRTNRRELAMALSSLSAGVVLLTASPVQIELLDLKKIYDILYPGKTSDEQFLKWIEMSKWMNAIYSLLGKVDWSDDDKTALDEATSNLEEVKELRPLLKKMKSLSTSVPVETKLKLRMSIWSFNPISSFMTRARRREEGEYRERDVENIPVDYDDSFIKPKSKCIGKLVITSERDLFKATKKLIQDEFSHVHLRQLSSSLKAIEGLIQGGINGYPVWTKGGKTMFPLSYYSDEERKRIEEGRFLSDEARERCKEIAQFFPRINIDFKWNRLVKKIKDLRKGNPNRKIIVFTQWNPTFEYLVKKSTELNGREIQTFSISSDVSIAKRNTALQEFRRSEGSSILFCTDILSEGIDIYEADALINYDLPYNPQRLEQRIGRIDRIGQQASRINIINLYTNDSTDADILDILKNRIRFFEQSVGPIESIVESESDPWTSIDETEIARIIKEQEIRKSLDESGALKVLDDILIDETKILSRRANGSVYNLCWLPLVHFLRILSSGEYEIQEKKVVSISNIDIATLRKLKIALGSNKGTETIRMLEPFISNNILQISASESHDGWNPYVHSNIVQWSFDMMLKRVPQEKHTNVEVSCDSRPEIFLEFEEVVLYRYETDIYDMKSSSESWWVKNKSSIWSMHDELTFVDVYETLMPLDSKVNIIERDVESIPPEPIENDFQTWRTEEFHKSVNYYKLTLEADLQRYKGRKKFIEERMESASDSSRIKLMQQETMFLEEKLGGILVMLNLLKNVDEADISSKCYPLLQIRFASGVND